MKCPKCREEMECDYEDSELCINVFCTNRKCKGWYCFMCDGWHPYGTLCSFAGIDGHYLDRQERYDKWCKEHKDVIWRMLKNSGGVI